MRKIDFEPSVELQYLGACFAWNRRSLRIVGGAVRDLILGQDPKDIDLCTDATPHQMVRMAKEAGITLIPTGLQHGTVTFVVDGESFEITTLRIDVNTDGRHADVQYTLDFEEDAARRDLTINAMSMDFDGNIYDYFCGYEDLQSNIIRFVGDPDTRLREDYLRILRFFRFAARAHGAMAQKDLEAIQRNVRGLQNISRERVWAEMSKLLISPGRVAVMRMMHDRGVFENIGMNRIDPHGHDMLDRADDAVTAIAGFICSVPEGFARSWKMSVSEIEKLVWMVDNKFNIPFTHDVEDLLVKGFRRDWVVSWVGLHGHKQLIRHARTWEPPEFPVRGQDLLDSGVPPGKDVGQRLAQMKREWIASRFTMTKEELLCLVQTAASPTIA